jgi:opacity protein-like surface antigen
MKRSALLALVFVMLLPVTAFAARGGYISGFLGVNMAQDVTVDSTSLGIPFSDRVEYDPGVFVGGAIGGDLGVVRIEGEISYRNSEIDRIRPEGGTSTGNVSGDLGAAAFMANMFIDLTAGAPITPYIGGGVGIATLSLDDVDADGFHYYDSDDEAVLAYQLGGGIAFDLSRNVALDIGYRFFGTEEADFANSSLKYETHTVMMGLRYTY